MAVPDPATASTAPPTGRRRRRGAIAFVVILILVALAAVAGELATRAIVRDQVRERAVAALGLPADHPVDVGLGGIVLVQLIAGRLDEVRLSSEDVAVAGLTVDADIELTGVPVREGAGGGAGAAHLRLDAAAVEQLLAQSQLPPALSGATVALAEPDVVLSNEFEVLGSPIPVELAVTPGAANAALTLTPARAKLGELDLGLDQLAAVIGVTAEPTSVCIADRLPAGLAITAVAVVGDHLEADAAIAEGTLSDPALQQPGTCD